jgi:hypothetical protein
MGSNACKLVRGQCCEEVVLPGVVPGGHD